MFRNLTLAAFAVGAQLFSSAALAWFFFWIPTGAIQKAMEVDPDSVSVSASDRVLGQCAGLHVNQATRGMSPSVTRSLDGTGGGMVQPDRTQTPESKFHSDIADIALRRSVEQDKVKQLAEAYSIRWSRVASAGDMQMNRQYGANLARGCVSSDLPIRFSDYSAWQARQDDQKRRLAEEERNRLSTMQPTSIAAKTAPILSQSAEASGVGEKAAAAPEGTPRMGVTEHPGSSSGATSVEGQSTIVFVRRHTGTTLIDAGRAVILEIREQDPDPKIIGIGGGGTQIAYRIDPGPHTFMVLGENTDFMIANVQPNTTYYVSIEYQSGGRRNRYTLRPVDVREQNSREFEDLLAGAKSMVKDADAARWLSGNMPSVKRRLQDYYGPWLRKPDSEKVMLGANVSGAATQTEITHVRNSDSKEVRPNLPGSERSVATNTSSPAQNQIAPAAPTPTVQVASAERSVIDNPKDAKAWRMLGDAHASSGNWTKAEKAYAESLALSPNDPQSLTGLASTYCKRYDRDRLNQIIEETRRTNRVLAEYIVRSCILP